MGVVRDITIDNLTQAVQGISSTGISDSTGQAINNTLGTLGKDTSLQGIISAISGLGQTLGNDKANIDGSNIVDSLAFRNAIGVKQYIMEYKAIPLTYSSSSNPVAIGSVNVAKTGYTPLGVIGWQVSGASSSLVYIPSLFIDNVSVSYTVRVTTGGTYNHTLYVAVLYQSN